ncbi:MAG: flavodoxin family protein [Proteobacteria bacterium]|nr:flavodoxin family protein [Pseudomonadota bacterium]
MKSLVVYSSKSGNTRKLAEAVHGYLRGDKEIATIADAPDPAGYAFVAVGFWFKAGQPDPDSQTFLARLMGEQDVYLFATHGAAAGSVHAKNGMKKAKELAVGAHVVATFSCSGEVDAKFMEVAAKKNPQPPWLVDAPAAKGHPDANDLKMVVRMLEELDLP